jgi:hypothetical protein
VGAARPGFSGAHAFGAGHRRSDSKISRSRVMSGPCAAAAASTAARAIAGFHPSPVSAARAWVQRIAAPSLLPASTPAQAALELAAGAPTWAPVSAADVAGRFALAGRLPASLRVTSQSCTCASALAAMIGVVELARRIGPPTRASDLELICRARDRQRTAMVSEVTRAAQQAEVRSLMASAVGAMDQVMDLQPSRRPAAGHAAAASVSAPHQARGARRDVLIRALGYGAVDRSDVLSVAHRSVDRRGFDRDLRARAFLPALPAALAHRHRNLIPRPARDLRARRAIEHCPA